jgi:hypothetical protein
MYVSFGYVSDKADADCLMKMIMECFVVQPAILKKPKDWLHESNALKKKFHADDFELRNDESTKLKR